MTPYVDTYVDVSLSCEEYGDAGVLVHLESTDYESAWRLGQRIGASLREDPVTGLVDVVASYLDVFVSFDPATLDHDAVRALLAERAQREPHPHQPRHHEVPVVYGGTSGPDLEDVARTLGLGAQDVVDVHTGGEWTIRFVGSPVAAPMMDGPRMPASVPRLPVPRVRVEPGSVALSGFQSIVYNAASPGGWQVIGRTPVAFFDLTRPPHVPYRAGDTVRFRAVEPGSWTS